MTSSDDRTVVVEDVDDEERIFSYHDPTEIPSTRGMVSISEDAAKAKGAVACSKCFDWQDCTSYAYPYWERGDT